MIEVSRFTERELNEYFSLPESMMRNLKAQFPDLTDKERRETNRTGIVQPGIAKSIVDVLKDYSKGTVFHKDGEYRLYHTQFLLGISYAKGTLKLTLDDKLVFDDEKMGQSTRTIFTECLNVNQVVDTLQLYNRIIKGAPNSMIEPMMADYVKGRSKINRPFGLVMYTKNYKQR